VEHAELIELRVLNDGVPPESASHREGGGLENLAGRLAAVRGTLDVTVTDGQFEVLATVPSRPGNDVDSGGIHVADAKDFAS